jgi:hypothetical protein
MAAAHGRALPVGKLTAGTPLAEQLLTSEESHDEGVDWRAKVKPNFTFRKGQ